jgi:hypothetical protein
VALPGFVGVTGTEVVTAGAAVVTAGAAAVVRRTGDGVTSGVGVMTTGAGVTMTGATVVAGERAVVWAVVWTIAGRVVAGSVTTGGACMRSRPLPFPDDAKIASDASNDNAMCFNMVTRG